AQVETDDGHIVAQVAVDHWEVLSGEIPVGEVLVGPRRGGLLDGDEPVGGGGRIGDRDGEIERDALTGRERVRAAALDVYPLDQIVRRVETGDPLDLTDGAVVAVRFDVAVFVDAVELDARRELDRDRETAFAAAGMRPAQRIRGTIVADLDGERGVTDLGLEVA